MLRQHVIYKVIDATKFLNEKSDVVIIELLKDFLELTNFDKSFLSELPDNIDPCGENGEFHSFVYDGPVFKERVGCKTAEIVLRDNRFYYCDLIPT